nr:MAG TPA: hypothetical protein [Caudoviricetes sp.]
MYIFHIQNPIYFKHMLKKYMPIIIILNIKYNVNNC